MFWTCERGMATAEHFYPYHGRIFPGTGQFMHPWKLQVQLVRMVWIRYVKCVKGLWNIFKKDLVKFRRLLSDRIFWKIVPNLCNGKWVLHHLVKQTNKKPPQTVLLLIWYSFIPLSAELPRKIIIIILRRSTKLCIYIYIIYFCSFPS